MLPLEYEKTTKNKLVRSKAFLQNLLSTKNNDRKKHNTKNAPALFGFKKNPIAIFPPAKNLPSLQMKKISKVYPIIPKIHS